MFPMQPQNIQGKPNLASINKIKYQITVVLEVLKKIHKQNLALVFYEEPLFQIYVTSACLHLFKEKN